MSRLWNFLVIIMWNLRYLGGLYLRGELILFVKIKVIFGLRVKDDFRLIY